MSVEIGYECEACDRPTVQELDTRSGEIECTRCHAVGVLSPTEVQEVLT